MAARLIFILLQPAPFLSIISNDGIAQLNSGFLLLHEHLNSSVSPSCYVS